MLDFNKVEASKGYSPLKPGLNVKVKLNKVELGKNGDLDFYFEGTDVNNAGSWKPRFWISDFDKTADTRYAGLSEEDKVKSKATSEAKEIQLGRLILAYLTFEQASKIDTKGGTAKMFAEIVQAMNPSVIGSGEATIAVIYKGTSDTDLEFSRFNEWISTEHKPAGLRFGTKKRDNGVPFDRTQPMSYYGITADSGAPTAPASTTFGSTTATVPGGPSDSDMPF
jgi:hypothetical protein